MALSLVAWAWIAAGASTAATVYTSMEARKDQKEQGRVQAATDQANSIRQQRQAARQARIRRAQILQSAEGTGVEGSSGVGAATGDLQNTLGQQSSMTGQNRMTANSLTALNNSIAGHQATGQIAASLGSLFSSYAMNASATQAPKTQQQVAQPLPAGTNDPSMWWDK